MSAEETAVLDRDGQPFTPMALHNAAEAGMSPQEYRDFVRALNARSTAEKMTAGGGLDAYEGATETERNEGNYKAPREDAPPADGLTSEERLRRVSEWLLEIERKVEVSDITHMNKRVASDYLRSYRPGTLPWADEFLGDVLAKTRGRLSDGQAKGVLNCLRASLLRPAAPAPTAPATAPAAEPEIPEDLAALLP